MDDEQIPVVETTEQPIPEAPEQGASSVSTEEQPEAEVPAWRKALDEAPEDEFWKNFEKHPKFTGRVGSLKQQWEAEQKAAREAAEAAAAAKAREDEREKLEAELDDLYNQNPLAFADKVQNDRQISRAQARLNKLQAETRDHFARQIGAHLGSDPVLQEILQKPESAARFAEALKGVPEDQSIPVFTATLTKLAAEHAAEKLAEERIQERLKAERAAWETEAAASGLLSSDRPRLVRGQRVANLDPEPNWRTQPKEWEAWYDRNNRRAG